MAEALTALQVAYADLARTISSVSEEDSWRATGCRGWTVRDLLLHLLADAQRGLVALATPSAQEPDRDSVTYWVDAPSGHDPEYRELRAVRTIASAYGLQPLKRQYDETNKAVLALAERSDPDATVPTQGHTLRVDDLLTTLVVEAAIHHLDLVVTWGRPGPAPESLVVVRRTLYGLLGSPVPVGWDDVTYARAATGRRPLSAEERAALGADARRLPLLS
jgi:hypothetical protein